MSLIFFSNSYVISPLASFQMNFTKGFCLPLSSMTFLSKICTGISLNIRLLNVRLFFNCTISGIITWDGSQIYFINWDAWKTLWRLERKGVNYCYRWTQSKASIDPTHENLLTHKLLANLPKIGWFSLIGHLLSSTNPIKRRTQIILWFTKIHYSTLPQINRHTWTHPMLVGTIKKYLGLNQSTLKSKSKKWRGAKLGGKYIRLKRKKIIFFIYLKIIWKNN